MASTYSTSLKLELMATGDQSGTWGDTTNTNLGTLLEQAVTGVLSVAQGDATLTLTSLNGASDQARNAVVNLTGAMTAGRDVIVPTANKVYLIKNSTTGGFVVTVKTVAGTGVTIPNGTARWVYCDGTNVVDGVSGPWTPSANDGQALGASGTAWADLFLASGAVINWNAGDVTLTHAANTLAFAGASSGYTFDAAVTPSANDAAALGSATVSWADLFLASGAVVNIANGNWVMTHTSAIMTVGTGDLRVTTAGTNSASVATVGGTQTLTAKTLTSPVITTSPTAAGATWTDLGSVTTVDINGGTVDGAVIGGASAAAGTFTTATANAFVPNNSAVPTNGMYLPAANTLGWAVNSAAEVQLTATALSPIANDGNALGTTTLMWADLFLASGGVVNWNNGTTTLTQSGAGLTLTSAGALTFTLNGAGAVGFEIGRTDGVSSTPFLDFHSGATAVDYDARILVSGGTGASGGGAVAVTAASTSFSGTVTPSANDGAALGTTSLGWADLHLATGGVINWANGNITVTHSASTLTFNGSSPDFVFGDSASQPMVRVAGGSSANQAPFLSMFRAGVAEWWAAVDASAVLVLGIGGSTPLTDAGIATQGVAKLASNSFTPNVSDAVALGTTSLMWADLFLASGGVINWNNGDVTETHSANTLTWAGATNGYIFDTTVKAANLATSGTNSMRISQGVTGAWYFTDDTTATVKLLIDANGLSSFGGQIAFPATQNASSNANTLDDYEEGTWTPALTFGGATTGITYTSRNSSYIKVGKFVYVNTYIILTSKGSATGTVTITGLPFTSSATYYSAISVGYYTAMSSMANEISGFIGPSSTTITLTKSNGTTALNSASLTDANFNNATDIIISGHYEASA